VEPADQNPVGVRITLAQARQEVWLVELGLPHAYLPFTAACGQDQRNV
jgi:hypothetical protein